MRIHEIPCWFVNWWPQTSEVALRFSSWPLSCANAWLSTPSRALRTELIADRCLTEAFFFYAESFLLFSFAGFQVFQLSSVLTSNDHHIVSLRNEHYILCFFSDLIFKTRIRAMLGVEAKNSGNWSGVLPGEDRIFAGAGELGLPAINMRLFSWKQEWGLPKFHGLNKLNKPSLCKAT